jgi:nucleotide-binding universal stress UspA family protein
MFDNVIVAVDESTSGRDAVALAEALHGGKLTRVEGRHVTAASHAAAADLICVGSAHHGPLGRLLLGDAARAVMHHAACPVAIAPRGYSEQTGGIHRVAVGFDGSRVSRAALDLAAAWCAAHAAALTVHVAWEAPTGLVANVGQDAHHEQMVGELHREAVRLADDALPDLPRAERRVTRGGARHVLVDASAEHDALFIGSSGRGAVHRLALGSTSDHLVHHATCPVVVVTWALARPFRGVAPPSGHAA